jgi:hypothetical protein
MPQPPPVPPGQPGSRVPGTARRQVLPLVPGLDRPPARRRPLPDAAGVRLIAVPDSAPPYDDERTATGPRESRPPRRLTLATSPRAAARTAAPAAAAARTAQAEPQPPGEPAPPGRQTTPGQQATPGSQQTAPGSQRTTPGQSAVPGRRTTPHRPLAAGRPGPSPAGRAAPAEWPSQFAQVLAETLAGSRPQGQIVPWTTDQARKRIRQLGPMLAGGVQPRVRRIVTSRPTCGVVEMTVIVGFGSSVRALAVRLERDGPHHATPGRPARSARWLCTAIEAA